MSDETVDSNQPIEPSNSASNSQNIPETDTTNMGGGLSKKQSSNETQIKPLTVSGHDTNQNNDNKLNNKNHPPFDSIDNEGQPASGDSLRSSVDANEPTDDVSPMDVEHPPSSKDEQIPVNTMKTSAAGTKDDEHQKIFQQQIANTTDDQQKHPLCRFRIDKPWLNPQYHDEAHQHIKKPDEIENEMDEPPGAIDADILDRIQGSIIGMALGDALGAHVEFRPHEYMVQNPVDNLKGGGTWGLKKGQFTDDTSMALCLANSLVACRDFVPYDQLVRYKWWYQSGYMSSTGQCFDIGAATRQSIVEFERRQRQWAKELGIKLEDMDYLSDPKALKQFDVYCSDDDVAGNGALMRLAPVPLFFYRDPPKAVEFSGYSGQITHGDQKAYDACRYYSALIVAALRGYKKKQLLDRDFYSKHKDWFGEKELHPDIKSIAEGSYQKDGYKAGIRGKGYIVRALEAALWAFWSDENSFEKGALAAVNLGDDTDTTAAIYGQLAGAFYGYQKLPEHWLKYVYAKKFMEKLSKWIAYEGNCWQQQYGASTSQL